MATRTTDKKPKKPYPDFPLFPHTTKRWAKKIRGKLHYFGPWTDWEAALNKYKEQADDLHAGLTPRAKTEDIQMRDVVNVFLTAKRGLVDTGELRRSTFNEYYCTCETLLSFFGLNRLATDIRPEDFAKLRVRLARGIGPCELGKRIGIVRSVFKYGIENQIIKTAIVFGSGFKKPSAKALRMQRAQAPTRMLEAVELRKLIDEASEPVEAMILLGLNCGFGNSDIAEVLLTSIDLDRGWIVFPRPKTGTIRRCPLWPETIKALRTAIKKRPDPKDPADAGRAFITKYGAPWVRYQPSVKSKEKWTWVDGVNLEFRKLLTEHKLKRAGIGFYTLRHVFRTVADEVNDRPAIDKIMGHVPNANDMGPRYVERIDDARLRKVTDHVRSWLFAKPKTKRDPKLKLVREKIA